ncbi:hypothetical protein [Deinococcus multiflagellatus]|uniref:Tetratricopeptide repeat protein n=1 Tax=Deinococcus multiflagellatus TaxID=1656887 RepID=A0ABW1ZNN5_9DEIO
MRDIYASYLITNGKTQDAEYVLLKQREFEADTSRTYILLGRLASRANNLETWAQVLHMALERAQTNEDYSRYYAYLSNYYVRCNRYEDAEEAAQTNLQYAIRSRSLSQHFNALSNVAYARQMKGNMLGAKDSVLEGLDLAEREGNRFLPHATYMMYQLSEILKDTGEFDGALDLIQRGLSIQHANLASVPYLYNTRGLIYMEFGRLEDALMAFEASIEAFTARRNVLGLLMPHTFATYALYRLGWLERIAEHRRALRDVVHRVTATRAEYTEPDAYLPLVEGIHGLVRGEHENALAAFESIALQGRETYDSVLLSLLLAGRVRVQQGTYTRAHAEQLVAILDKRGSSTDVTARMYRGDFEEVYRACLELGVAPERFRRILEIPEPQLAERPAYPLDPRRNAQKSMSMLRHLLKQLDPEVERSLLSLKHDPRGYRTEQTLAVHLKADIDPYLSVDFSPENSNRMELEGLLSHIAAFLPGLPESVFAQQVNAVLEDRTVAVALHLAQSYEQQGEFQSAARVLLLGLRFVPDPELGVHLSHMVPLLPAAFRGPVQQVLYLLSGDGNQALGDVITDALIAM